MPSRFGLRQLVILLFVLGCGTALVLAMVQNNRLLSQHKQLQNRVEALEHTTPLPAPDPSSAGTADSKVQWAEPGIPIHVLTNESTRTDAVAGGDLVEALESTPQTLTPFFATDAQARRVIQNTVCQTLANVDSYSSTPRRASLATAYQADPDGRWVRIKLDDRARFSDGTPVTAEDVKFSLDVLRMLGLDAERTRGALENIENVEVISDRVAEFHFKEPRPLNLLHALCSLYIVPKHFYEKFTPEQLNQSTGLLMGSGPFILKSVDPDNQWKPGADIVLVRDPLAWGDSARLDSIRFVPITSAEARLTALRNGNIDIMRPSPDQFAAIAREKPSPSWANYASGSDAGSSYSAIAWNCGNRGDSPSIVADRRIRAALTHLVDRQQIKHNFYALVSDIATGPFPPDHA